MTKYKFNEEAFDLGLPTYYKDNLVDNICEAQGWFIVTTYSNGDIELPTLNSLYHRHNQIPYDPSKHPITLKVVNKDGEQVWPWNPNPEKLSFHKDMKMVGIVGAGYMADWPVHLLSVQFDLEEVEDE